MRLIFVSVAIILAARSVLGLNVSAILEVIPEEERWEFVKYYVRRGYELTNDLQGAAEADPLAIAIYNYVEENNEGTVQAANDCVVCWPDGRCLNLCDAGVHPLSQQL